MYEQRLHQHLNYWRHQCDLAEQHSDEQHLIMSITICKSIARKIRSLAPDWQVYAF